MKIYYIRHGEPTYNEHDELTEYGNYQVNEISKFLSKIPFKLAFTSPILRAKRSAEPTLNKLGITSKVVDWASEDFVWFNLNGEWEGNWYWLFIIPSYLEIFKKYYDKTNEDFYEDPEIQKTNFKMIKTTIDKGIDEWFETLGFVHDRKNKKYIAKNVKEKEVILFAHQGVSTFIFSSLLDECYPKYILDHPHLIDCASINIFNIDEKTGKISLEVYNDIKY